MKAEFWKATDGRGNSVTVFVCDGRIVTQTRMHVREEIGTTVENRACGQLWAEQRAEYEALGWTFEELPQAGAER